MTQHSTLYKRYRFFKQYAGWRVGHSTEEALALARAEQWAEDHDLEYEWNWDDEGDLGDHAYWCKEARRFEARRNTAGDYMYYARDECPCTHDVEYCVATYHDEVKASLSGIIDADRIYRRVVEAELALEAMQDAQAFIYY